MPEKAPDPRENRLDRALGTAALALGGVEYAGAFVTYFFYEPVLSLSQLAVGVVCTMYGRHMRDAERHFIAPEGEEY